MTLILQDIARDHGLDSRALIGKYILQGRGDLSPVTQKTYKVPESQPPPQPRYVAQRIVFSPPAAKSKPKAKKGGRKPKFSTPPPLDGTLTQEFMDGLTIPLLKDACKMRKLPITGSKDKLIKRIQDHQENPQAPQVKKGKKKAVKIQEPVHNHELDGKTHGDCEQCQTYGNPLDVDSQNETFEIHESEVPQSPVVSPVPEIQSQPQSPVAPRTQEEEFTMGDDDIQAQLKAIVAQMSDDEPATTSQDDMVCHMIRAEEEMQEFQDHDEDDPFDSMEYGDILDEEE